MSEYVAWCGIVFCKGAEVKKKTPKLFLTTPKHFCKKSTVME